MKYYRFILIIIVFIFGCAKEQKRKHEKIYNLTGSWMVIEEDSTYNEVFYDEKHYYYYFGDSHILTNPRKYSIKSDTLITFTKEENTELRYFNFIEEYGDEIVIINPFQIKSRYIPIDSSEYTINKIKSEVDLEKYRKGYLSRKNELIKRGIIKKDSW